jgi:hypothetical protein
MNAYYSAFWSKRERKSEIKFSVHNIAVMLESFIFYFWLFTFIFILRCCLFTVSFDGILGILQ